MSTYFFLVCRKHKEFVFTGNGRGMTEKLVDYFIVAHDGCTALEAHNEYWMWSDENSEFYESLVEWEKENFEELEDRARVRYLEEPHD